MKKVLFLLFFVSVLGPSAFARTLGPVDNIAAQGDVAVAGGRLSGKGVKVRMHGDSLSAEGFADRREWMLWRGDSAFYAGEETFFAISAPVVKVPAAVWPLVPEAGYSSDFFLFVRENKEALRSCPASFSAKVLPMVSLVLPEGETLRRVVPLECVLRVEVDSTEVWERRCVRWYADGEASSMDYYYPYDSIGAFRNNYDRVGSTIETGYHSEAEFELEGNRISWGTLWSVANTFEGATGILQDDAEVYHEYDAQGRLTASNTDRIAEIEYNHLSQPVRVKFFDGKEQCSVYDNVGQLIKRYTRPGGGRADRIDQVFIGPYEFGANLSLKKIHFAGGYFTADGKVHYHITDYQGSVGAVIRGDGVVEQRTHYYPYGEPWLEPEGDNRRLHTGKERLRWGTTPIHDFGARILPPAIPFWTTPDPCAERYYHLGPYTFCAADPINHADPSGCIFTESAQPAVDRYMNQIKKKMDNYKEKNKEVPQKLKDAYNDLNSLIESDQLFDIVDFTTEEKMAHSPKASDVVASTSAFGYTTYNLETDAVTFHIDGGVNGAISAIAHEFKHGNQFLEGKLDLAVEGYSLKTSLMYDYTDEREAFDRGHLFGGEYFSDTKIRLDYKLREGPLSYKNLPPSDNPNLSPVDLYRQYSNSKKRAFRVSGVTYKPAKRR